VKSKPSKVDSIQSRKLKGTRELEGEAEVDADKIRVQRILTLVKGLDEKAKKVFFALQARQLSMRTCMTVYLTSCEEYNVTETLSLLSQTLYANGNYRAA
jgi:sister-chromatid-cohesion protein PDS5